MSDGNAVPEQSNAPAEFNTAIFNAMNEANAAGVDAYWMLGIMKYQTDLFARAIMDSNEVNAAGAQ